MRSLCQIMHAIDCKEITTYSQLLFACDDAGIIDPHLSPLYDRMQKIKNIDLSTVE